MTLRDYLNIIRQRWTIIVSTVLVVTASTLFFSFRQTPIYSATTRLLVKPIAPGYAAGDVIREHQGDLGGVLTEAEIIRSELVASRVAKKLKLDIPVESLIDMLSIVPTNYTTVLNVTANNFNRELARDLANAFAKEYIDYTRSKVLQEAENLGREVVGKINQQRRRLQQIQEQLRGLREGSSDQLLLAAQRDTILQNITALTIEYNHLLDKAGLQKGIGQIIQVARTPAGASSPNHVRNAILGFLVALPLAVGLTLLRDSLSDTVKTKEEAEHLTGADTLALIPWDPDWRDPDDPFLASKDEPASPVAEAYRTLRVNLEFANDGAAARFILVTSPGRNEGKSSTAANLAFAFSEAGRRAVAVDADLRRPRLHEFFDADVEPGLSDVLAAREREGPVPLQKIEPNLWFLASGSENGLPDVRLGRKELETMFGTVGAASSRAAPARRPRGSAVRTSAARSRGADVVLLDTPSVLRAAEVSSLSSAVDGVVLVLHAGVTRRMQASRAAEQIRKVGGRILGVALVGVREEDGYGREDFGPAGPAELVNRAWDRVVDTLRR